MSAILLPNGLLLHYEVLGRGRPPVLFLHSWVGSWRYWLLSMEEAALYHRAYALDLPGFGGSVQLDQGTISFDVGRALESIEHFLDTLGVNRCIVVGHGLGGLLALEMAWKMPQRVAKLLTVALPLPESVPERWQRLQPRQVAGRLFLGPATEEIRVAQEEVERTPPESYRRALEWVQGFWRQSRAPLTHPWLLVFGQNDPVVPPPTAERLDGLPQAPQRHALVIPEAGHFPMLEHPRAFHRVLRAFLQLPPEADLTQLRVQEEWQRRVR